jgi:hypothetical protein
MEWWAMAFKYDAQAGNVTSLSRPDKLRIAQQHLVPPPSWLYSRPLIKKMRESLKKFQKEHEISEIS